MGFESLPIFFGTYILGFCCICQLREVCLNVQQGASINRQISVDPQLHKKLTSLGQNRCLSTLSNQGHFPPRRWLSTIGLIRPGITAPVISRSALQSFGILRRHIHDVSRRVGQSLHVQKALLRNAEGRRAFCSENPRKKGEKIKP